MPDDITPSDDLPAVCANFVEYAQRLTRYYWNPARVGVLAFRFTGEFPGEDEPVADSAYAAMYALVLYARRWNRERELLALIRQDYPLAPAPVERRDAIALLSTLVQVWPTAEAALKVSAPDVRRAVVRTGESAEVVWLDILMEACAQGKLGALRDRLGLSEPEQASGTTPES